MLVAELTQSGKALLAKYLVIVLLLAIATKDSAAANLFIKGWDDKYRSKLVLYNSYSLPIILFLKILGITHYRMLYQAVLNSLKYNFFKVCNVISTYKRYLK